MFNHISVAIYSNYKLFNWVYSYFCATSLIYESEMRKVLLYHFAPCTVSFCPVHVGKQSLRFEKYTLFFTIFNILFTFSSQVLFWGLGYSVLTCTSSMLFGLNKFPDDYKKDKKVFD